MSTFQFSQSMAKTRRKCHAAYSYRYHQHLSPKRPKLQLLRGSILDEMLTEYFKSKKRKNAPYLVLDKYAKTYSNLLREEKEYYGDLIEDIRRIFQNYERTYATQKLKCIGSQIELKHVIDGIEIVIHIDKVVKDEKGQLWIMDHKTHKNIPNAEQRFSDIQMVIYPLIWNIVKSDTPVTGIVWDYLRTKPPAIPEKLVKGGMSRRANIDSDWFTYEEAVIANGYDPNDYLDMKKLLEGYTDKFFQRIWLPVHGEARSVNVLRDFIATAKEARDNHDSTVKNLHWLCGSCEFYKICQAELHGLDVDFVRKAEYKVEMPDATEEVED